MMYDKICTNCGKPFQSDKPWTKLCSKECNGEIRRRCAQNRKNVGAFAGKREAEKLIVKIKITAPIEVFEHMRPEIGSVHAAEKIQHGEQYIYIIRNIGKHGLVVRENECVEVGGGE